MDQKQTKLGLKACTVTIVVVYIYLLIIISFLLNLGYGEYKIQSYNNG